MVQTVLQLSCFTDEERRILRLRVVIDVGYPQRLHGSFSDTTQNVSQKHVDPQGNTGLPLTVCVSQKYKKGKYLFYISLKKCNKAQSLGAWVN